MLQLFKKATFFKTLKPLSLFSKYPKFFSQNPEDPQNPQKIEKSSQKPEKVEKVEKTDKPLQKPLNTFKSSKTKPFYAKEQKASQERPLKVFSAFGPKTEYFNSAKEQKTVGDLDEYFSVPKSLNRAPFDTKEKKEESVESESKSYEWQKKTSYTKIEKKKDEKNTEEKKAENFEENTDKIPFVKKSYQKPEDKRKKDRVFDEKPKFSPEKKLEKPRFKDDEKPKFSAEKKLEKPRFKDFDFKQTFAKPRENIEETKGNFREINENLREPVFSKEKSYKNLQGVEQKPKIFKFSATVQKKTEEDFYQEIQPEFQKKPSYATDLGHMQFFIPGTFLKNLSIKQEKKDEKKDQKIEREEVSKTIKTDEKKPFIDKKAQEKEVKTEGKTDKIPFETVEIQKEKIAEKPNLQEIYAIYSIKEKINEKDENLFFESLFDRNDFPEIQQNFMRILKENRLLWLSFSNVHNYYAKLIENEDLSGLITLLSHLKDSKYNFSAFEISLFDPFLQDISSLNFLEKIQIFLHYISFLPPLPSNVDKIPPKYSVFFKKVSVHSLFRLILQQIQPENPETHVFLDISFKILRTFIDLNFLNFKVIRPYDLAEWCILNLENAESLPFLIEILSKYESKTFSVIFSSLYLDFLKKKGYAPYNNSIIEENYLKLIEKFSDNSSEIDSNSFEFLLILADGLKNWTIILDLFTKIPLMKTKENFDFFFVYDYMIKTIPSLSLENDNYTKVLKKLIDEEMVFLESKPRIHTIAMIKGLIKEGKYKESSELFFSELYRDEVSEFESKKLMIFLNSVILGDIPSMKNLKKVNANLQKLVNSLSDSDLHRLFRNESQDLSILSNYPNNDMEAFGKKQQKLDYFRLLFEESGFSIDKMKEKIENRDKSYDKHLHFKYHEFLGKFDENLSNFDEEENKKKFERETLRDFYDLGKRIYEDSDEEFQPPSKEEKKENPEEKDEDLLGESEVKRKVIEIDDDKDDDLTEKQFNEIQRLKKAFMKDPERLLSEDPSEEEQIAILLSDIEMFFKEELEMDPEKIKEIEEMEKLKKNDKNLDKNKKEMDSKEKQVVDFKKKRLRFDQLNKMGLMKVVEDRMLFFNDIAKIVKVDCKMLKEEVFELIVWGIENKEPCGIFFIRNFMGLAVNFFVGGFKRFIWPRSSVR